MHQEYLKKDQTVPDVQHLHVLRVVMQNVQRYEIERGQQREWNKGTEIERHWRRGEQRNKTLKHTHRT